MTRRARSCVRCKRLLRGGEGHSVGGKGKHRLCSACHQQDIEMQSRFFSLWNQFGGLFGRK